MSIKGVVKLDVTVEPDGTVKLMSAKGGHPLLVDAALQAIRAIEMEAGIEPNCRIDRNQIQSDLKIMSKKNVAGSSANWALGRFANLRPSIATEFEKQTRKLRLTNENCSRSEKLRKWCKENRHRCYIPEWLLKEWGFSVNADLS